MILKLYQPIFSVNLSLYLSFLVYLGQTLSNSVYISLSLYVRVYLWTKVVNKRCEQNFWSKDIISIKLILTTTSYLTACRPRNKLPKAGGWMGGWVGESVGLGLSLAKRLWIIKLRPCWYWLLFLVLNSTKTLSFIFWLFVDTKTNILEGKWKS